METVTLRGLKPYLKRHRIKVGDPIAWLGRRYPDGKLPRGYKAKYSQAYHQLAVPVGFAEELASVLNTKVEILVRGDTWGGNHTGAGVTEPYDSYSHLQGMEVEPDPIRDENMSLEEFLAIDCKGCTSKQCFDHFEWLKDNRPDLTSHVSGQRAQCAVVHGRLEITKRETSTKKIKRKK